MKTYQSRQSEFTVHCEQSLKILKFFPKKSCCKLFERKLYSLGGKVNLEFFSSTLSEVKQNFLHFALFSMR